MKKILLLLMLPIAAAAQKNYPLLLKQYMQDHVKGQDFSGCVLVTKNNKILLKTCYGLADREWNIPNAPDTKFRIGSLTKQFTAACILLLNEKGKLSLDDKLNKFIPDFPKGDSVTIHMLLKHTSGIASFTNTQEFQRSLRLPWPEDSMIALLKSKPYDFAPGTNFRYDNSGYYLLACIIEKAGGQTYSDFLHDNILSKLGMTGTGVDQFDPVLSKRGRGYYITENDQTINGDFVNMDWFRGCGNMYSTLDDLYKWDRSLNSNIILSNASRQKMFSPGWGNYGYGFTIEPFIGHRRIGHTGDVPGFKSNISRYPDDDVCIIMLSNNQSNAKSAPLDLAHILFDTPAYFAAQKAIFTKQLATADNDQEKRKAIWQLNDLQARQSAEIQDPATFLPYVGVYGSGMKFYTRGHKLYCRNADRDNEIFELRHIKGGLYTLDENVQVEFSKDSAGKTPSIKMFWVNGNMGYQVRKEELDRRRALWKGNYQKAMLSQERSDSSFLAAFTGVYQGGLDFYIQNKELYCRNAERGNDVFKLRHIMGNLFLLDENVQVEFIMTGPPTISPSEPADRYSLKMFWRSGDEDIRPFDPSGHHLSQ